MKKRMLALLLTLCMVVSLLPAQMVVAEGTATDLTLDANQIGTFTPTTSGTYVFYDTTSQNENGNEWGISIQYTTGDNTYADVGVAVNDTYNTRGYRAELTANTTYTVVANNNSNRTLSLKVAPAAYGGEISFSKLAEEAKGAIVGGQWGLDVVPVAPNGVLGQVNWSAVVSATDDTTTDCVDVTEKGECATLDFIKEGTFLLKATCGEKGCSMEITVQDAPAEPPQGGDEGGNGDGPPRLELFELGTSKTISFNDSEGITEHRYHYSCLEDAAYTIYYTYEDSSSGVQVNIYEAGTQDALPKEQWFAWLGGNQYAEGERWDLQEGTLYELVFTYGGTIAVDYSFDKVTAPTGLRYAQSHISNFVGSSDQLNVVFEPVYASAEVTHAVTANNPEGDDPSVIVAEAASNEWASFVKMLNPGTATLTATAKISDDLTLTATADVTSRAPIVLDNNADAVMVNTGDGVRVRYSFTPAESGEYTFDFTASEELWIGMWNPAEDENAEDAFSARWSVKGGESNPYAVALEANVTYILDVSCDYTNLEIFASVTDDGDQGSTTPVDNVTIKGNGSTFITKKDGNVYFGRSGETMVNVPAGSSLQAAGYEFTNWEGQNTREGWWVYSRDGVDLVPLEGGNIIDDAKMMSYTILDNVDYVFESAKNTSGGNQGGNQGGTGSLLVSLDGYHGDEDYGGGMMTLPGGDGNPWQTRFRVWEWASAGQTIADLTGISSMPNPKWEGFTFEGWLLYREDGDPFNGPRVLTLESRNPISTADMLAATVPGYNISYIAKWAEIGWEYYENIYDPYYGVGGGGEGGEPDQNIHVSANNGTMSYTGFDGKRYEDVAYSALLKEGECLADYGFKMTDSDVKYWTDRTLDGWRLEIVEPIYGENGEWIDSNWETIEGLFTTEEVINYKITDGRQYQFYAQWSGNDEDYMVWVEFFGNGAMVAWEGEPGRQCTDFYYSMHLKKNGTTIGSQADATVVGVVEGDPAWGTFQGWLSCEYLGQDTVMKSTTVYSFDQIKAMTVEENLMFIPKWSGVALEDYEETFGVLMPVDYIVMTVNTKYDVAAETTAYFSFTAPADGAYQLRTDAHQGIDSEMELGMDGWARPFFDGNGMTVEMTKGETVKFVATATQAAKVWVEDVNEVVKMELVSQDKTATYILDDYFDPAGTLGDVVLKLTFADGTVIEGNGAEVFQRAFWGNSGVPVEGFWEEDNGVVTVGWESGKAKVSYQIALDKATVIGFEVIPAADMFDIYEGTMCYLEDGEFVYEGAVAASAQMASYKFTWSDGTVETYPLDLANNENELYYHGVPIIYHTVYPIGWSVGTHNVPICYGDLTDDLPVTIKENKAKSIEVLKLGVTDYTLGDPEWFVKSGNGWVMEAFDYTGLELKVTYTDGTSKVLTEKDMTEFRGQFSLLDNTIISGYADGKVHTEPGKNTIYIEFMGCVDDYEVKIVEQAVVDGNASVSESTINELLAERKGNTVTLSVAQEGTTVSGAKFPTAAVENLLDEKVNHLVVELGTATVTLDEKALTAIADQAEGATITLSVVATEVKELTDDQQAALKNKNVEVVLTALILSDGEPIGDFKGGSVKVKINFKPEKGYDYKVVYVADDGTITEMVTEVDETSLAFWTGHFSDYVVTKEKEEPKPTEPTVPETTVPETTAPQETKPSNPAVPNTGDNSGVTGMMLLMLASGTAAAALWLSLRKRKAV